MHIDEEVHAKQLGIAVAQSTHCMWVELKTFEALVQVVHTVEIIQAEQPGISIEQSWQEDPLKA